MFSMEIQSTSNMLLIDRPPGGSPLFAGVVQQRGAARRAVPFKGSGRTYIREKNSVRSPLPPYTEFWSCVYGSVYVSIGWRALAHRVFLQNLGCSKKDCGLNLAHGGFGIWIDRVPCARRCGGLRDVVQGDYLQLPLSGRGTAATSTIRKERKSS